MTCVKTCNFFAAGTASQFEWVLQHYDECLSLKAHNKSSKPDNVIKLDKWYQNELPQKIKSRGKDAHLVHEEIVQTIKWKLSRGKYRPNLTNLVRMNTPRVVTAETKKAFRKIAKNQDIQSAITTLCTLKGVGPAMASAILAAAAPELAPYMADECLWSMPDVESLDYTVREYMKLVEYMKVAVDRLNNEVGSAISWNPHKVELAIWTHYIANDLKPELLSEMPDPTGILSNGGEASSPAAETGNDAADALKKTNGNDFAAPTEEENGDEKNKEEQESNGKDDNSSNLNGKMLPTNEVGPSSTDSESTNDSTTVINNDDTTNDSVKEEENSTTTLESSPNKRGLESEDEPPCKKVKTLDDEGTAASAADATA